MRALVAAGCLAAAAWAFPSPEKLAPLVTACEGHDLLSNCTASFEGVCATGDAGMRYCGHGHEHHVMWQRLKALGRKMGLPHMGGHDHGSWDHHLGDCGSKKDGDACTVPRIGQCVPSGKCPMFHGEMVCYPQDAHPPKFVTEPCDGKVPGDDCSMMFFPGKCEKLKYQAITFCKVQWPFGSYWSGAKEGGEELEAPVVVV
mmetsp:Transcript_65246/g.202211  ORF Transcript_65246/g.202211 Transcript_65246/m.202211 type:complete len:201 (-) Transcript_65246:118-720(-)